MKTIIISISIIIAITFSLSAQESKSKKTTQSRSAKTGKFVSKSYANSHKSTTYTSKKKK